VILDDSTVRINAVLKDMAKPDVAVHVTLDAINIDRYLPPAAAEKQGRPETGASLPQSENGASAPSSKAPAEVAPPAEPAGIDYEPLRQLVIEGTVNVGELIVHGAKLEKIAMKLVGRDGIFDLDPLRLDLYQGAIELVGKFNVQQDRPEALGELKATNVMVGPLLKDSMQKDILEGTMGAAAKIGFSGDNAADIKKSLNGSGNVMFIDGAIVGLDIAEIGRTLAAGAGYQKPKEKPRTDFAELQVLFVLEDGVFRTRDSSLLSPLLRVQATGSADLVNETLDMRVRPKIVGTLKGQGDSAERSGLTVPIRIEGTFAEPRYSADLSGLVDRETIEEAIKDPEAAKQKMKSLEESGKSLLEGFGLRKKK
jgi:AsmA protein